MKLVITAVVILATLGVLSATGVYFGRGMLRKGDTGTVVRVERVAKGELVEFVSASGEVEPRTKAKISARVAARIETLPLDEGAKVKAGDVLVKFDDKELVQEYFKGTGGPEIELRSGNTSCDIGFEAGKRYIVYASQDGQTGALGAFSCSRTRLFDDYAKADISYLRRAARCERPTMLYGKLRGADAQTVELGSGVASVMFRTTTLGSLSGRVVDREGRPVSELQVELLQAGSGQVLGRPIDYLPTREDGKFVFAGRRSLYAAPFLSSYFPNAASSAGAQVITIADGVSVDLGDFVLQERYPTVAVSGVVVTPDDKPVPGAYVYLDKSGGEWDVARSVQTDAAGRFVHQAFEGVTYTLRANADSATGGTLDSDRVEVTAVKTATPVRLVLKAPK